MRDCEKAGLVLLDRITARNPSCNSESWFRKVVRRQVLSGWRGALLAKTPQRMGWSGRPEEVIHWMKCVFYLSSHCAFSMVMFQLLLLLKKRRYCALGSRIEFWSIYMGCKMFTEQLQQFMKENSQFAELLDCEMAKGGMVVRFWRQSVLQSIWQVSFY